MKSRSFRASVLLSVLFTLSLFVLLFLSAVVFRQFQSLRESSKWVLHSQQVDLELERLISNLREAETGQRGFLLTKDTSFLLSYDEARNNINRSLANLKSLFQSNHTQVSYLDTLYFQIANRLQMLNTGLKISDGQPLLSDSLRYHLTRGRETMDRVLVTIRNMEKAEMEILETREKKLREDISITPVKALGLVLFSVVVFLVSFLKIQRDVKRLRQANSQLLITNQAFEHAEEIAGISNWQLDLKTHEVVYSDNQYRMLGCVGRCFEPSFENFLDFVHPDDRGYLRSEWEKTLYEQKLHQSLFRVIRQDGEIRFIRSMGRLILDTGDKKLMTGINWDITELHLNNLRLEEKNRELENSNAELASFNHIASHDLQEPLRKIQMFVSRILERDMPYVSEASKEAFEKIQSSARHMQNLIDDLLAFSRVGRANQLSEKTDLNQILDNALQELGTLIDEKEAEVENTLLPTLNVVPFQIHQLFTNLLSNSLKFTKNDQKPVIRISAEMIKGRDVPSPNAIPRKRYWKLTFSDNGIGFDNQYAEKIFILFHRLHDKNEYSGTGIGLAICKKIVDNHGGFITAESHPGEGATFRIFLPVA